ncbi:endoribonuclease L-PSP [Haladaptatus litoreus]|uniref:Endoribonuclease L-PSP n=1 Tax=Haladaptatus litoreus TaxID=553468 RepID=A0A1N7CPP9_9EURY|nr:Rid family detoxifying hydrolase [Haladaptatus litoreus]SIR65543.1 endoribonuclease L-PSP [Haladaptatus litoreus]
MEEISTDTAPPSIGPFSQGIRDGDRIYVSGQGPVDPESGDIVGDTIEEQTARTLENIEAVLAAANRSLDDVVKATVFVQNMDGYDAINDVYADYVSSPYPARSAVQVEDLPIDIGVEIEVVASARGAEE